MVLNGWIRVDMDQWMDGRIDGRMDGWICGIGWMHFWYWIDGSMDGWIDGCIHCISSCSSVT